MYLKDMAVVVSPPYPEHFASGTIINAFTPTNKTQIESLVKAAKEFQVDVILVMDSEQLEMEIQEPVRRENLKVKVIPVPKSTGIVSTKQQFGEPHEMSSTNSVVYTAFSEYFRGKFSSAFSQNTFE